MNRLWRILLLFLWTGAAAAAEPEAAGRGRAPFSGNAPDALNSPEAAEPVVLLILPFAPVDGDEKSAWIGRAIAEALSADLSIDPRVRVSPHRGDPAADADAALAEAHVAEAVFVIFGTFQKVEDELRITGKVLDVESASIRTGLKATGPLRELFTLEDLLVHQIRRRLLPPERAAAEGERADPEAPLVESDIGDEEFEVLGVERRRTVRRPDWFARDPAPRPALAAGAIRHRYRRPYVPYYSGHYGFSSYYYGGYAPSFYYCPPSSHARRSHVPSGISLRFKYRSDDGRTHIRGKVGGGHVGRGHVGHGHVGKGDVGRGHIGSGHIGGGGGVRRGALQARTKPVGAAAPRRVLTPRGVRR